MWSDILFGAGCVGLVEGLLLALAPGRLGDILAMLAEMPVPTQRLMGLTAATLGVLFITIAGHFG